jgi:ATP:corrinoid adenosyltransferase
MDEKTIYLVRDNYSYQEIFAGLVFDKELTEEEYRAIDRAIDNIKDEFMEDNYDWQIYDVLEELQKTYKFTIINFHYKSFYM